MLQDLYYCFRSHDKLLDSWESCDFQRIRIGTLDGTHSTCRILLADSPETDLRAGTLRMGE